MSLSYRNHYVPRLYLKNFADADGYLSTYRLLVPTKNVREWKRTHISSIGYQEHLYTRSLQGSDTDEVETWLNREFEDPGEEALRKAITGARLYPVDYRNLVRLLASQIVRTPAFLVKGLPRWREETERWLEDMSANLPQYIRERKHQFVPNHLAEMPKEYLPIRVTKSDPVDDMVGVKIETVVGRGHWLFAMRHHLTSTLKVLHEHRWTVLEAPEDIRFPTSDDPVINLNFHSISKYDFGGGWGSEGSEIILPLSPRHLLYTKIGHNKRSDSLTYDQSLVIRKMIIEHAFRFVYSPQADLQASHLRPRQVSLKAYEKEKQQWKAWKVEQDSAEQELLGPENDDTGAPSFSQPHRE